MTDGNTQTDRAVGTDRSPANSLCDTCSHRHADPDAGALSYSGSHGDDAADSSSFADLDIAAHATSQRYTAVADRRAAVYEHAGADRATAHKGAAHRGTSHRDSCT